MLMLKQVREDLDDEAVLYIHYRLPGSLFNLRRLHTDTKTIEQLFCDVLFTEDEPFVAHTERAQRHLTSCFAESIQLFGLEVSSMKTEVLHHPAPLEEYCSPQIAIREVDNKLAKAHSAFGRLYKKVWNNKHLKNITKISVYRAVVLATLLHGSKS